MATCANKSVHVFPGLASAPPSLDDALLDPSGATLTATPPFPSRSAGSSADGEHDRPHCRRVILHRLVSGDCTHISVAACDRVFAAAAALEAKDYARGLQFKMWMSLGDGLARGPDGEIIPEETFDAAFPDAIRFTIKVAHLDAEDRDVRSDDLIGRKSRQFVPSQRCRLMTNNAG